MEILRAIHRADGFYARKYRAAGVDPLRIQSSADFASLPFTTKAEIAADQTDHPPYGSNLVLPRRDYSRVHQTSGTSTGRPLRWLDTPLSWSWILDCWSKGFRDCIGLTPDDRVFLPFSFGPFLGFWAALEAVPRDGHLALSRGGMPTTARLRALFVPGGAGAC